MVDIVAWGSGRGRGGGGGKKDEWEAGVGEGREGNKVLLLSLGLTLIGCS